MSKLGLLPISLVLVAAVAVVVSYAIAVANGDVRAAFPYISDTGSERPESGIFGQLLNVAACLAFCTMYVRYKAVAAIAAQHGEDRWLRRMNTGSMYVGLVSAFGVSMVANFQEGTSVEIVHIVGAFMTFAMGLVYCFLQTALSYHLFPACNGRLICRVRLAITLISLASLIITIVAAGFALHKWDSTEHPDKSKFKWAPSDPGYSAHVVSTAGEWVTAMTFLFFFFTYVREFNKFDLEVHTRPLVQHLDEILHEEVRVLDQADERTKLLA
ncbi:DNA damage-regulated autophagy modulator protein 1 [Aplysia californica]|uniref:DNA damage-regulated autophagy modulator protein 1 n=1 Tax=Aplysia californica TaxID=6500 RepID=A0ABM1W256_APLCA|nr:DNA damage-regulated autophagy modulator protein 1 [Aplysia californica]